MLNSKIVSLLTTTSLAVLFLLSCSGDSSGDSGEGIVGDWFATLSLSESLDDCAADIPTKFEVYNIKKSGSTLKITVDKANVEFYRETSLDDVGADNDGTASFTISYLQGEDAKTEFYTLIFTEGEMSGSQSFSYGGVDECSGTYQISADLEA